MVKYLFQIFFAEIFQDVYLAAGEEGRDDFEGRVLGCRADKYHGAVFDTLEKGVLLRLVEAVYFIYKEDRPSPDLERFSRRGHDFTQFLDAGRYRIYLEEIRLQFPGDQPGKRRLSRSRRPPEDH